MARRRKKFKEPSLGFMLFTAVSGVSLGALLAISLLLSKPVVNAAAKVGDEKEIGDYTVYYAPGVTDGSESRTMRARMTRLQRKMPGSLAFDEGEVNYFLSQFEPAASASEESDGENAEAAEPSGVDIGAPNVQLEGDRMVFSTVWVVNPEKKPFKLTMQADVDFNQTEAGPRMKVRSMSVNSLPVPSLVSNALMDKMISQAEFPADLADAWKAIKEIKVQDGKLIVTL